MCQELVLSECILLWFLVVSEIFISFKILVTIFIYIPPLFHSSSPLLYGLQIPLDWPFHYDSYSFIHFSHFAFFYFFVLPIEYFCCCCSLLLSLGLSNPLGNIFQLFLFFNSRIIIWFFYMVLVRCQNSLFCHLVFVCISLDYFEIIISKFQYLGLWWVCFYSLIFLLNPVNFFLSFFFILPLFYWMPYTIYEKC